MALTTRANSSFRRPVIATFAPSRAKTLAIASPIPVPPPVIRATLFASLMGAPSLKELCWACLASYLRDAVNGDESLMQLSQVPSTVVATTGLARSCEWVDDEPRSQDRRSRHS